METELTFWTIVGGVGLVVLLLIGVAIGMGKRRKARRFSRLIQLLLSRPAEEDRFNETLRELLGTKKDEELDFFSFSAWERFKKLNPILLAQLCNWLFRRVEGEVGKKNFCRGLSYQIEWLKPAAQATFLKWADSCLAEILRAQFAENKKRSAESELTWEIERLKDEFAPKGTELG